MSVQRCHSERKAEAYFSLYVEALSATTHCNRRAIGSPKKLAGIFNILSDC
jgi:hypothetical protein